MGLSKKFLLVTFGLAVAMLTGGSDALAARGNSGGSGASNPLQSVVNLQRSSLLVLDDQGKERYVLRPDQPMVPASTLKILTALLAIEHWGLDYRFQTDFYLDKKRQLWVKGYGDPFLISEEIDLIAAQLKKAGVKSINGIGLDTSYFAKNITIDGKANTTSPYDAPVSTIAANFNTATFVKSEKTGLKPAEPQTPVTPVVAELAADLPDGEYRVNLMEPERGPRYFAEILQAKLLAKGVAVSPTIVEGVVPRGSRKIYRHFNSHRLSEVLTAMLKVSNNFIANQLFLMMGAQTMGAPTNLAKSQTYALKRVKELFGWEKFDIAEGSGLSRRNQMSARQLVELLQKFKPYRHLLPSSHPSIHAKTGTLRDVSCYAGYIESGKDWAPFALLINQPVENNLRYRLAQYLAN